jgi:hypothetical protein
VKSKGKRPGGKWQLQDLTALGTKSCCAEDWTVAPAGRELGGHQTPVEEAAVPEDEMDNLVLY